MNKITNKMYFCDHWINSMGLAAPKPSQLPEVTLKNFDKNIMHSKKPKPYGRR